MQLKIEDPASAAADADRAEDRDAAPVPPRTTTNAALGPINALFHPAAGAIRTAAGTRPGLLAWLLVFIFSAAALILFFLVYSQTQQVSFSQAPTPNTNSVRVVVSGKWTIVSKSFGETLRSMFPGNDWLYRATLAWLAVSLGMGLAVVIATVIVVPRASGRGRLNETIWNALAAIVANVPIILVCIAVIGIITIKAAFWRLEQFAAGLPTNEEFVAILIGASTWIALVVVITRVMRCASLIGEPAASATRPVICESCGYDLTHISSDRRCTECGAAADDSLTDCRRSGVEWERSRKAGGPARLRQFIHTAQQVFVAPRLFFEKLQVTTSPQPAQRFALYTYVTIALFSWGWLGCIFCADQVVREGESLGKPIMWIALALGGLMIAGRRVALGIAIIGVSMCLLLLVLYFPLWLAMNRGRGNDLWLISMLSLGIAPMAGWLVHRLLGGLLTLWWFWRGELHDPRAAEKVIAYNAAFLWYPWLWFFAMFMSLIFFNFWISDFVAWTQGSRRSLLAGMLEPIVIVVGWCALVILWIIRMIRDARSVRWANR